MYEQSKSAKRRYYDGNFLSRYFAGNGLDVGCGDDSVGQYAGMFPLIKNVVPWDKDNGDAQLLQTIPDQTFDFVHSSHSLEHMNDPYEALENWIRVLKPGGYVIITVPDEDMYEHGIWPSRNNSEHAWSFTISKDISLMPKSVNVVDLVKKFASQVKCHRITLVDDFYRPALPPTVDQTLLPNAECAIEIVLQKR